MTLTVIERLTPDIWRLIAVGALLLCGLALAAMLIWRERRPNRSQHPQPAGDELHAEPWPDGWRGIPRSAGTGDGNK